MGDFQVEIDSINQVASGMSTGAINTATQLQQVMASLDEYSATGDWSQVPSCRAFGASYTAAIQTFHAVADELVSDATSMQKALQKIAKDYADTEDRSKAAFEARMAKLGSQGFMTDWSSDAAYQHHKGDLHSDHAEQAPHQDTDTATSGSSTPSAPPPVTTPGGHVKIE